MVYCQQSSLKRSFKDILYGGKNDTRKIVEDARNNGIERKL